ncbi:TerC family protein [bacterium]|nr:TerC family protein [bacterium]
MTQVSLFPFTEYWWFYILFILFVLFMLALDLGVFHRKDHAVGFKEALGWTIFWITLGLLFCVGLYFYCLWKFPQEARLTAAGINAHAKAHEVALQFLTGLIIEKSLSVDNIFVFVVLFHYFQIKPMHQHRILFFGIMGALVFRSIFISIGSVLMNYYWVVMLFGLFLIYTGFKLLFVPEKPIEPEHNPIMKLLKKFFPVTHHTEGHNFFIRHNGTIHATPLFVALAFIEISDIIFAIDSVPAIFAITKEPLIVFTSNIFAILGLRAMYFMLAGIVHKFRYLRYGLGIVLMFVGVKMSFYHDIPIGWSLAFISAVIGGSIAISLIIPPKYEKIETSTEISDTNNHNHNGH